MYYLNIEKLKQDLKQNKLSEKDKFKYFSDFFVTTMILVIIPILLLTVIYNQVDISDNDIIKNVFGNIYLSPKYALLYLIIMAVIIMLGMKYLYNCNNGDKGNNFIERFISIYYVVNTRMLIPWTILLIPIIFVERFIQIPNITSIYLYVYLTVGTILSFLQYGKHIKDVANNK